MRLTIDNFRYNGLAPDKIRYNNNTVYKINYNSECVYEVATLLTPTITSILKGLEALTVTFSVNLSDSDRIYLTSNGYGTLTLVGYDASNRPIITTTTRSISMSSYATNSTTNFGATYNIQDAWSGTVTDWKVIWTQESYQASSVSSQFRYICTFESSSGEVPEIDEPREDFTYRLGTDYALIGLYVVDSDPWMSIDMSAYYRWLWDQLLVGVDIPSGAAYILPCTSKNLARCIEYYASAGNSELSVSDIQDDSLNQEYPEADTIRASLVQGLDGYAYHNIVVVFNPPQSFGRTFRDDNTVWQPLVADIVTEENISEYIECLPGNPLLEEGQIVYFLPTSDLLNVDQAVDHNISFALGTTPLDLAISQLGAYMGANIQGEVITENKPYYTLGEALQQRWADVYNLDRDDEKQDLLDAFDNFDLEQLPLTAAHPVSWPLASAIMDGVGAAVFGQRILTGTDHSYDTDWSELIKNVVEAVTDIGSSLECTPVDSPSLADSNSALIQAFLHMGESHQWSITVKPPESISPEAAEYNILHEAVQYVSQIATDSDIDPWVTKP